MCGSEYKTCPRCHAPFECRAGAISSCQCSKITLTPEEREYISNLYDDCLCSRCLVDIKNSFLEKHPAAGSTNLML